MKTYNARLKDEGDGDRAEVSSDDLSASCPCLILIIAFEWSICGVPTPAVSNLEATMNAAHPSIEGITFVTSPEGHRFERTQLRAFVVAITLGGICWYGYPATNEAWAEIVFQTIIFLVPFLGLSYAYNTWERDATFRGDVEV